ncbi:DUF1345 domain-containing protein [Caulobacter sp. 17J65-9]|uniref:DUF1345 domain-containing protein n=1 Tax=Caulobacter sp. 17J65-9 TaxID=2709382 RepID=UPI0013CC7A64|nr:DUF1345 domain-containing protein [Caulobacter sp. 17J65-9]NEX93203.1 DUF1345 domain-containing protein [Caulobacter sp. 17J65-9]
MRAFTSHFTRHTPFYGSVLLGVAAWWATPALDDDALRLVLAGDVFYVAHLVCISVLMSRSGKSFMARARRQDEGAVILTLVTVGVVALSLGAVFALLNSPSKPGLFRLLVSIASIPLGWLTLHTIAAFHYANAYYTFSHGEPHQPVRGLNFPGTPEPGAMDFLYYSFTVGMTAQVSDTSVETTSMRFLTLAHGVVSFFFNTVLVALAVNLIVVVSQA